MNNFRQKGGGTNTNTISRSVKDSGVVFITKLDESHKSLEKTQPAATAPKAAAKAPEKEISSVKKSIDPHKRLAEIEHKKQKYIKA